MPEPKKATATDAELILKLYDLRREPEMRKARDTMFSQFWPDSADEFINLAQAFGTDLNRYMRQVFGYWETACALVAHGALDEDLFFDVSQEMYPLFAKVHPFLGEFRERLNTPDMLINMEKVILGRDKGRERLARVEERLARFRQAAQSHSGNAA